MRFAIGPIHENGEKLRDPAVPELRHRYRDFSVDELRARIETLIALDDRSVELEYLKRLVWQLGEWSRARMSDVLPDEPIPRHGA